MYFIGQFFLIAKQIKIKTNKQKNKFGVKIVYTFMQSLGFQLVETI